MNDEKHQLTAAISDEMFRTPADKRCRKLVEWEGHRGNCMRAKGHTDACAYLISVEAMERAVATGAKNLANYFDEKIVNEITQKSGKPAKVKVTFDMRRSSLVSETHEIEFPCYTRKGLDSTEDQTVFEHTANGDTVSVKTSSRFNWHSVEVQHHRTDYSFLLDGSYGFKTTREDFEAKFAHAQQFVRVRHQ